LIEVLRALGPGCVTIAVTGPTKPLVLEGTGVQNTRVGAAILMPLSPEAGHPQSGGDMKAYRTVRDVLRRRVIGSTVEPPESRRLAVTEPPVTAAKPKKVVKVRLRGATKLT
jgi:hypothetical protein